MAARRGLLQGMRRHPIVNLLLRWGINALGILAATWLIPGIECRDTTSLLIVVVVLGLFNAFLKPLLVLFALPFVILTLGAGILFINAALFMLAASLVDGFQVSGFLAAFFGAVVVALVNLLLSGLIGDAPVRMRRVGGPAPRSRGRPIRRDDDDVIDV